MMPKCVSVDQCVPPAAVVSCRFGKSKAKQAIVLSLVGMFLGHSPESTADGSFSSPREALGAAAYVQASLAKIRAKPQADAEVLAQISTNTNVRRIARRGDWCEIGVINDSELLPPNSIKDVEPDRARQGFVACALLAPRPLTIEAAEAAIAKGSSDPSVLLDWYARSFWIAPSLTRWARVGAAMEPVYLDEPTRRKEFDTNKALRYKVSEFEAMKRKLASGIRVARESYRPPSGLSDASGVFGDSPTSSWKRIRQPKIKPSLFKGTQPPVLVRTATFARQSTLGTLAMIDALSAYQGASFRAVVTAPAYYASTSTLPLGIAHMKAGFQKVSGAMDVVVGFWDVGGLEVSFDQAAVLYGVTLQGTSVTQSVKAVKIDFGYDSDCSYSPSNVAMEPGPLSDAALWWVGPSLPVKGAKDATVLTRKFRGKSELDLLISHEIDLDGDGVDDFIIWQGRYQPQVSADGLWEAVFGNIDGQWQLLDYVQDADCT